MIREIELVSYLPPFLSEYGEIDAALKAEDPEFRLVWEAADRVLYNEFIATADEYGIGRYEKLLKLYPSKEDTLESRRSRVQARWLCFLPYTEKMLLEKLISICGKNNFSFIRKYDFYKIELEVSLELYGQVEELERVINTMLPCNMIVVIRNGISIKAEGTARISGGICAVESFFITNDRKERIIVRGCALHGGSFINAAEVTVIDDMTNAGNCPADFEAKDKYLEREDEKTWQNFQN